MTGNNQKNSNFLWLATGIAIGVTIMLVLVGAFVLYYTQPVLNFHSTPTPVSVTVDYDGIAKKIVSNDAPEKLCHSFYPVDSGSRDRKAYWEVKDDLFIVYVEIYPEVKIENNIASVQFTSLGAIVNRNEPTQNGYKTVSVDDPDEYNLYLQAALAQTSGNRGFMAHWIVPMVDGQPSNQSPLSGCSPIPYDK